MRHLGFERDEDAGLREKRPTEGNGGISGGFGPKLGSPHSNSGGARKNIFLKKEKFSQLLIKPVLAVQVLHKSQAFIIRQALMLSSVLIKVKTQDVVGQEGDVGGSPHPPRPHRYTRVRQGQSRSTCGAGRKQDLRSSGMNVLVPTPQNVPKDVHPQNTPTEGLEGILAG